MTQPVRVRLTAVLAVYTILAVPRVSGAQTSTTAAISGVAVDQHGGVLPGAMIVALDESTGARHEIRTDAAGRFHFLNLRVGGPYTVTVAIAGFADQAERDVLLGLGEDRRIVFTLRLASIDQLVVVTPPSSLTFDVGRAGTAANIPAPLVEMMPSVQRSLVELARLSPHFNASGPSLAPGDAVISVAGRNSRYNNVQIDGAVYNDLFGLSPSGAPGGLASAHPISLDAVQELQLVVSPYDVRQGGFSGGGVNVVTKSGSNRFTGTAFVSGRGDGQVGVLPALLEPSRDTRVGSFKDFQSGFALGGPIIQNRAFLFSSFESDRRTAPTGFSVTGDSGQRWGNEASVRDVLEVLSNQYGFASGSVDQFVRPTDSDKIFARSDVNLFTASRLAVRVNAIDGRTVAGGPSNTLYVMPDAMGRVDDSALSTVAQFNTATGNVFNELRVAWQRFRMARTPQPGFPLRPQVRVNLPEGNTLVAGSDGFAHANRLNQDIVEVTNDVSWARGGHAITAGTHNEFFHFDNLFIQNLVGGYTFANVANLRAGIAQGFARNYSNTTNPLQSAQFSVRQFGFYVGDQWRMNHRLTVTLGVRVDVPRFSDTPRANPLAVSAFGYATDVVPAPAMWSPRAGFNWLIGTSADEPSQLRGGVGLFAGRPPYVWLSNQYLNNGLDFTTLMVQFGAANRIPFVADPSQQHTDLGAARQTLNLVDPAFRYPQVLRGNLAYDRDLRWWNLVATAELLVSKSVDDVAYSNLNLVATGQLPDGRRTYVRKNAAVNDVILLSNTSAGRQWSASVKVERPFTGGFYAAASYLYNGATSVNDGTSQIASQNWANTFIGSDGSNPPVARSIYEVGHRVNLAAIARVPVFRGIHGTVSAFYNGQSGQPYSLVFLNSDANGDGRFNDIVYVPAAADEVIVINGSWTQLDAFLSRDSSARGYRGQIPPRNSGVSPWLHGVDARFAMDVPIRGRTKIELALDVINVLNLLNKRWGHVFYPSGNAVTVITYAGTDAATGKQTYNLAPLTAPSFPGPFVRDDLRSRWQARYGVRVRF